MYRVTQYKVSKVSRSQLSAQNQLSYNNWILKIEPLNTYRILKNDNPLQLDTMHYVNTSTVLNNLKIFVTLQCGEEEVMVKTKYKVLYCLTHVVPCDTLCSNLIWPQTFTRMSQLLTSYLWYCSEVKRESKQYITLTTKSSMKLLNIIMNI